MFSSYHINVRRFTAFKISIIEAYLYLFVSILYSVPCSLLPSLVSIILPYLKVKLTLVAIFDIDILS